MASLQNEADIGAIIKKSGIDRSELFITTKLPSSMHHDVGTALDESLKKLDTSYVDLYLMHWPQGTDANGEAYGDEASKGKGPTFSETWAAMEEKCFKTGKAKAIGVSNVSGRCFRHRLCSSMEADKLVYSFYAFSSRSTRWRFFSRRQRWYRRPIRSNATLTCPKMTWRLTAMRRASTSPTTRPSAHRICPSMPTRTSLPLQPSATSLRDRWL